VTDHRQADGRLPEVPVTCVEEFMDQLRTLIRASVALQAIYSRRATQAANDAVLEQFTAVHHNLDQTRTLLLESAQRSGLAEFLPLRCHLRHLTRELQLAVTNVNVLLGSMFRRVPTLRELLAELRQLDDEFEDVKVDLKQKSITVVTDTIALEGIYLGPFAIELVSKKLLDEPGNHSFRIEALDPHPAYDNDSVTHPHVRRQELCAGEAAAALSAALEQGRLADAFCLVRSVLLNYNEKSPHVRLDEWDGPGCHECGDSVPIEDRFCCNGCGYEYCSDCVSTCTVCDESRCYSCMDRCAACKEWRCSGCLQLSTSSKRLHCSRCLLTCSECQSTFIRDKCEPDSSCCPSCRAESNAELPSADGAKDHSTSEIDPPETSHEPTSAATAATQ
jgi:hypothetical protein